MTSTLQQTVAHLTQLAEGWECAAKLEDAIVSAYQPELDAFSASKLNDGEVHDLRLIRAVLDARSNRDSYVKDAAALRFVLAAFPHWNPAGGAE